MDTWLLLYKEINISWSLLNFFHLTVSIIKENIANEKKIDHILA